MMHANDGQVTPKTQHLLSEIHREVFTGIYFARAKYKGGK